VQGWECSTTGSCPADSGLQACSLEAQSCRAGSCQPVRVTTIATASEAGVCQ
jgi:hypothetical protein